FLGRWPRLVYFRAVGPLATTSYRQILAAGAWPNADVRDCHAKQVLRDAPPLPAQARPGRHPPDFCQTPVASHTGCPGVQPAGLATMCGEWAIGPAMSSPPPPPDTTA